MRSVVVVSAAGSGIAPHGLPDYIKPRTQPARRMFIEQPVHLPLPLDSVQGVKRRNLSQRVKAVVGPPPCATPTPWKARRPVRGYGRLHRSPSRLVPSGSCVIYGRDVGHEGL